MVTALPTSGQAVVIQAAVDAFDTSIGDGGEHHVLCGFEDYVQPHVYLSFHLISMRAAGWQTDFDDLGVVSGASALFASARRLPVQVRPPRRGAGPSHR
jgi:hypothetical protein